MAVSGIGRGKGESRDGMNYAKTEDAESMEMAFWSAVLRDCVPISSVSIPKLICGWIN